MLFKICLYVCLFDLNFSVHLYLIYSPIVIFAILPKLKLLYVFLVKFELFYN